MPLDRFRSSMFQISLNGFLMVTYPLFLCNDFIDLDRALFDQGFDPGRKGLMLC